VVWIEGEPGIGKSSLMAEALSVAEPRWEVGWAGADQLTGRLPLRVMQDRHSGDPSGPGGRRHSAVFRTARV
jgi:hypothetical protein